jgi:aminoglycoside 6'-N-acetyltransferase I
MTVEPINSVSNPDWLRMRRALWPDTPEAEHVAEMMSFVAEPNRFAQFMAIDSSGSPVGLAEASLRRDYVNGADTSPVGYLEGLFVEPAARRSGVARSLVTAVAQWATEKGCTELVSDTQVVNQVSQAVHVALGFAETERIVFYKLTLATKNAA